MGLKQEELITRYFEHKMSSQEEQNFLISLAASDDLRIAFRSHLELMKAVRQDKDDLRSVAQVRSRTLAALGISAAAVAPFIEQELIRSARPEETAVEPAPSWYSRLADLARSRKFALGTGLMLGFSTATVLMTVNHDTQVEPTHAVSQKTIQSAPVQGTPSQSTSDQLSQQKVATAPASQDETIQVSKGLNTIAQPVPSSTSAKVAQAQHTTDKASDPAAVSTSQTIPSVTKSNPGKIGITPAKIDRTKDSGKVE